MFRSGRSGCISVGDRLGDLRRLSPIRPHRRRGVPGRRRGAVLSLTATEGRGVRQRGEPARTLRRSRITRSSWRVSIGIRKTAAGQLRATGYGSEDRAGSRCFVRPESRRESGPARSRIREIPCPDPAPPGGAPGSRRKVPEVGVVRPRPPFIARLLGKPGPAAGDPLAVHGAAQHQHRGRMTVIGAVGSVLANGAPELGHRQHADVAHPLPQVGREGRQGLAQLPEPKGELPLVVALVGRVSQALMSASDLDPESLP